MATKTTAPSLPMPKEGERDYLVAFRPSATFPAGSSQFAKMRENSVFRREIAYQQMFPNPDGTTDALLFVGHAGTGKTAGVMAELAMRIFESGEAGDIIYIPAQTTSPEDLIIMAPVYSIDANGRVDFDTLTLDELFDDRLANDVTKYIVLDEPYLASQNVKSMLMEILQEQSINGRRIPGLRGIIALTNPPGGPYGRNEGLDIAGASRFTTVDLTQVDQRGRAVHSSKMYQAAIAADPRLGIVERDLSDFFEVYESFDSSVQRYLPPRLLHFALFCLLLGLPPIGIMPRDNEGNPVQIVDSHGETVSEKIFERLAKALGVSVATKLGDDPMRQLVRAALELGENVEFIGPHGVGKTAKLPIIVREEWAKLYANRPVDFIKFSATTMVPESNVTPLPIDGRLVNALSTRWAGSDPMVVMADELWRASWMVMTQFMEIMQERRLGGHPIPLRSFIGVNNPKEYAGLKYDVGTPNLAMQTRFFYHYNVSLVDSGWREYLRQVFGESELGARVTDQVLEWWSDDLSDAERVRISSRTVQRIIKRFIASQENPEEVGDLSLRAALPYVEGDYVPVKLYDLEQRLANMPLARLSAIARDVDEYERKLSMPGQEYLAEHTTVRDAFAKADLSQLEKHRDVCLRLYPVLQQGLKINLVRVGGKRQEFWSKIARESHAARKG